MDILGEISEIIVCNTCKGNGEIDEECLCDIFEILEKKATGYYGELCPLCKKPRCKLCEDCHGFQVSLNLVKIVVDHLNVLNRKFTEQEQDLIYNYLKNKVTESQCSAICSQVEWL